MKTDTLAYYVTKLISNLIKITIGFTILLIYIPNILNAQQNQIIKHYTTTDGMIGNKVYGLAQDSKGYLWIATNNGVCKFDGRNFTCFDSDDGLENVETFRIFIDKYDRVWLSSITRNAFYIEHNQCKQLDLFEHMNNSALFDYTSNSDSTLSIVKHFTLFEIDINTLSLIYKTDMLNTREKLYVLRNNKPGYSTIYNGKFYYNNNPMRLGIHPIDSSKSKNDLLRNYASNKMPYKINNATQRFKKNRYWHIPTSNGLYIVDLKKLDAPPRILFEGKNVYSFDESEKNIFWGGTSHSGLFQSKFELELDKKTYEHFPFNKINRIISSGSELFLVNDMGDVVQNPLNKNSQFFSQTHSFITKKSDYQLTRKKQKHRFDIHAYDIIVNNSEIYINDANMLYKYDIANNTWRTIYESANGIENLNHTIQISDSSILLLGTKITIIQGDSLHLKHELESGVRIYKYHQVTDSSFYLGTTGGVYSLSLLENNELFVKKIDSSLTQSIKGIHLVNDSSLVTATRNGGITLYRQPFSPDSRPVRKILEGIVTYDLVRWESSIYIGTSDGVYVMDTDSFQVSQHLNSLNVLSSNNVIDLEIHDTMLVVATSKGADFIPLSYQVSMDTPTIYFDRVYVNSKLLDSITNLNLKHTDNTVEFNFSSPYFGDNKLTYISELKNVDFIPIESEENRRMYPNLDPGDYIFKVKVKIAHLESKTKEIEFTIKPPWWNTWWFYGLLFVILLSIIYWLYRQQVNRQKAQISLLRQQLNTIQAQMNPHFLFNALQSLQYYIYKDKKKKSLKYIGALTKVMRKTIENTSSEFVSLENEVQYLESYLILEEDKLNDSLAYNFVFDENLKNILIPSATIQPFIENAIIHGFVDNSREHKLHVSFLQFDPKTIQCTISDNGVGIIRSKPSNKKHKSFAMNAVQKKLSIIQQLEKGKIKGGLSNIHIYDNTELSDSQFEQGTTIVLKLPLQNP